MGKCKVQPVVFEHDHHVDIFTDNDGRFLYARTTMPPLIPSGRFQMPTRGEEKAQREQEWRLKPYRLEKVETRTLQ